MIWGGKSVACDRTSRTSCGDSRASIGQESDCGEMVPSSQPGDSAPMPFETGAHDDNRAQERRNQRALRADNTDTASTAPMQSAARSAMPALRPGNNDCAISSASPMPTAIAIAP